MPADELPAAVANAQPQSTAPLQNRVQVDTAHWLDDHSQVPKLHQRIVQLICTFSLRPRLFAHPIDRRLVQLA